MINIAMEAEAAPFVKHLELKVADGFFPKEAPFIAYTGSHGETKVTVITNGKDSVYGTNVDNVGTIAASTCSFLALQKSRPDILINAGTCGGFSSKGAAIGDVYLTTHAAFHDRRIPLPGFDVYGIGKISSSEYSHRIAESLQFKTGVVSTSDSLDKSEHCERIMKENDATVKDMEAAAIAWAANLHNVNFLGLKVVTDIVDGDRPTQEEFLENLHTASVKLQSAIPQVLEYIAGKEHAEL